MQIKTTHNAWRQGCRDDEMRYNGGTFGSEWEAAI